jgi:adenine-specific DNA-methyltransferase
VLNTCEGKTVFDCCAGTGSVSLDLSQNNYKVICNDILYLSQVLCKGKHTKRKKVEAAKKLIEKFNEEMKGVEGYIFKNYSEESGRLYFTNDNAKYIDYYLERIEGVKDIEIKTYLRYCLLEAVSKISNIAGVYGAYLKNISENAKKKIQLNVEESYESNNVKYYNNDISEIIESVECDILYIDPPYNGRQYGSNYHVLETIALNDKPEVLRGMTGQRQTMSSDFCSKRRAYEYLENIVHKTKARYILISYNSEGILKKEEFEKIGKKYKKVECYEEEYKRFKSNTNGKQNKSVIEYLFKIEK